MKLVILTDENASIPNELIGWVGRNKLWFFSTKQHNKDNEYAFIQNTINGFLRTDREVLIVKFSGREEIAERLGDENPEMIFYLSENRDNKYYTKNYKDTFLDLVNSFYKETI